MEQGYMQRCVHGDCLHVFRWRPGMRRRTPSAPVLLFAHALDNAGFCGALACLLPFHGVAQFPARQKAVELPGTVHVALDGDARRDMFQINAIVGFVHLLAAAPGASNKTFLQVLLPDSQGFHALLQGGEFFRPYHNRSDAGS